MARSNGIVVSSNAPTISLPANFSVAENIGSTPITVTRSGNLAGTSIVPYSIYPITASLADYITAANGVLTFAPNESVKTIANSIIDDAVFERAEQYLFQIGADDATWLIGNGSCIVTINDNDIAIDNSLPLSALTRIVPFEMPYGILSPTQQSAVGTGGYFAIAVSRNNMATDNFAIYTSSTQNGIFIKALDNQNYNPFVEVVNALNYKHDFIPFVNDYDLPTNIAADTIGLLVDSNDKYEFGLYSAYESIIVGGDTSNQFTGVVNAIFDTPPIELSDINQGRLFLLGTKASIPTLYNYGTQLWFKVVPKQGLVEFDISQVTAISATIIGRAAKPLPPRNIKFVSGGAEYLYPSFEMQRGDLGFVIATASRAEAIPSGFFSPSGINEAGTTYGVRAFGSNGLVRTFSIDLAAGNTATYTIGQREAVDIEYYNTVYEFYATRGGIESVAIPINITQDMYGVPRVISASAVQSGTDVQITVTTSFAYTAPYSLDYFLAGTVYTDAAYGVIACSNGVTLEDNKRLQIPVGVTSFVMTVPTVAATGKTLITAWGADEQFKTNTTLTGILTAVTLVQALNIGAVPEPNTFNTAAFKVFFAAPCNAGSYPFSFRTGAGYATYGSDFIIESVIADPADNKPNPTISGNNIICIAGHNNIKFEIRTIVDTLTESAEDIWMTVNGVESNAANTIAANIT